MESTNSEPNSSLSDRIFALLEQILNDIWTSPLNLTLVFLIIFLIFKLFLLKRKPDYPPTPVKAKPQLPKMAKRDLTVQELRSFNGKDSNGRILTAIYGDIFDVSRRSDLYGPGGSYSLFSGRDATRALAKLQLSPDALTDEYDNIDDLNDSERASARGWHEDFREKYEIVGRLLKPGEEPSIYPVEEALDQETKKTS